MFSRISRLRNAIAFRVESKRSKLFELVATRLGKLLVRPLELKHVELGDLPLLSHGNTQGSRSFQTISVALEHFHERTVPTHLELGVPTFLVDEGTSCRRSEGDNSFMVFAS